ncbi:unnamed protein product [Leuciscus chuanchicus]
MNHHLQRHHKNVKTAPEKTSLPKGQLTMKQALTPTLPPSSPRAKQITRLIGEFIADYMAPFNMVENRKFIQMFNVLEPKFKMPCRGHFSEKSYITITAEVINEKWERKSFVLQTHNASNMDIAVRESGLHPHIKCLAHVVNLASKRGLAVSRIARLLGRVRRITTFFHKSTTATAVLTNKQTQLELPKQR